MNKAKLDQTLVPQDERTSSDRRISSPIVPGGATSLSCEGLPEGLPAGPDGKLTTAEEINESKEMLSPFEDTARKNIARENIRFASDLARSIIDGNYSEEPLGRQDDQIDDTIIIVDTDDDEEYEEDSASSRGEKRKTIVSPRDKEISPLSKTRTIKRYKSSGVFIKSPVLESPLDVETRIGYVPNNRLMDMNTEKLMEFSMDCLNRMEKIRVKSKRLQGRLSGSLKNGLLNITETISIFGDRLDNAGDVSSLKLQNAELSAQLRALKRNDEARKQEHAILEAEVSRLGNENKEFRNRLEKMEKMERDSALLCNNRSFISGENLQSEIK